MTKATTGLLDWLQQHSSVLPEETVAVQEWGREIILRGLSSRERDLFEAENLRRANSKAGNGAKLRAGGVEADLSNFRARLVSRHIVENGMRTFANAAGEEILGDQPSAILDRLFEVARRLSGFTAQDVEELAKNSVATGGGEASSASPASSDAPSKSSAPASANGS